MSNIAPVYKDITAFGGTSEYHRMPLYNGFVYTDGVDEMAKKLNAYWVFDVIATNIIDLKVRQDFILVKVETDLEDNSANLILDDGNGNVLRTQGIPFTDLKYSLKLYAVRGRDRYVILLPEEY